MDLKIGDIVKIETLQLRLSWSDGDNGLHPEHGKLGLICDIIKPKGLSTTYFYKVMVDGRRVALHRNELIKYEFNKQICK